MELRSNRSRSKTPYLGTEIEKIGNHVEQHTITRTTKNTATTKVVTEGVNVANIGYATSETHKQLPSKMKNVKSGRTLRSSRYKTSDYSSEDGEAETVTTGQTVDQNMTNQLIEEARKRRSASNSSTSSHISALEIYRAAGEYWNKYPKTDWTYARSSKDRFEIAPGVIAMPNMSRKSIHSNENSEYLTTDKYTNTSFSDAEESNYKQGYYSKNFNNSKIKPRTLFNNNVERHTYTQSSSNSKTIVSRFFSVFTSIFITIFSWILSYIYYVYDKHNAGYVWFGKKLHKFVSRIMLLDTWLLQSSNTRKKKISSILAVCLIPLLLLGGWWLLSGLSYTIYDKLYNVATSTTPAETSKHAQTVSGGFMSDSSDYDQLTIIKRDADIGPDREDITFLESHSATDPEGKERIVTIREKVIIEPPTAGEIAAGLTEEQLAQISNSLKAKLNLENEQNEHIIIDKILHSPTIQNIINNYNNLNVKVGESADSLQQFDSKVLEKQQHVIEDLKEEIQKMKVELSLIEKNRNDELSLLMSQLKAENLENNAKILHQLKKCCRHSFIQMESYVTKILGNLLGAPRHLTNEKEISNWLHSIFVAKQDLEARLANLTENLKSNYDGIIQNNGNIMMDDIASKITKELQSRVEKLEANLIRGEFRGEITVDSLTDDYVKKIVKEVLAVYDADKTGLVDYAMEPSGGQVLSTRCSESYHSGTAVVSVLGIPLWYPTNTPRTVITPGVNPGECWAFQNFPGFLVIKLIGPVKIEAFSYEHISQKLMPHGKIDSAPKDFAVYGLKNESDTEPVEIGRYHYDYDGPPLQFFAAQNQGLMFDIVELRVFSNHGNPNYTCLYRFRVHGTLSETPT